MNHEILPYIRLVHIVFGVIWAGANIFLTLFVYPASKKSGISGNEFLKILPKTNNMPMFMTISGLITIVSGIWIIYYFSGGFNISYFNSSFGKCILAGGICTIIAFLNGVLVVRQAGLKLDIIGVELEKMNEPPIPEVIKRIGELSNRIIKATAIEAILLFAATLLMAIGRYI